MICNSAKTELIVFGVNKIEVAINNVRIQSKDNMKVLGFLLENKLSWEFQIKK